MSAARFTGKVAFVTGAASGMGRATSVRLASEGASVYGVDVNEEGLAETAKLVSEAGGKIETALCNVGDPAACAAGIEAAVAAFGRLDVLCNIAGIAPMHHMRDVTPEIWERVMSINLAGPFFLAQAALPHLLASEGNIVNISSNAGVMGQAYTVPYCASKGGVVNMTRAMAMEFAKEKIRINCVCPGGTKTGISSGIQFPENADFKLVQGYICLREMAEPEDIASVIAFIASDDDSWLFPSANSAFPDAQE